MILWSLVVTAVLAAGLTLLLIEIFTPGFGVVGISGILLAACAVVLAFYELDLVHGLVSGAASVVLTSGIATRFRRSSAARQLVLEETHEGKAPDPRLGLLTGRHGRALTPLKPAGTVDFDGKPVDVVADGIYVEADTEVRVIKVEGTRVVVRPVTHTEEGVRHG